MSRVITPGTSYRGNDRGGSARPFFYVTILREYGTRGAMVLASAALVSFTPVALLFWFNAFWFTSTVTSSVATVAVVKPERFERDQKDEEPGATGLLQITCEVPTANGWRELWRDDDPDRPRDPYFDTYYVRHEQVYLRRSGSDTIPFAHLGRPPISVWLPAGDYEVLVIHDAPRSEQRIDARSHGFPLVSVVQFCSAAEGEKTVCRVRLPHHDWGCGSAPLISSPTAPGEERFPTTEELQPLTGGIVSLAAIPSPAGVILSLPEPQLQHDMDHRQCTVAFAHLQTIPREWTREQLLTVRNWLPASETAARTKLTELADSLEWRAFLSGWTCFALAGIAGLVLARWGAYRVLEPHRRLETADKVKLCAAIFVLASLAWVVVRVASLA
jgi:hypothetical protein